MDGSVLIAFVQNVGRFSYRTTLGATATVEQYDYGEIATDAEIAEIKKLNAAKLAKVLAELAEAEREIQAAAREIQAAAQSRAREMLLRVIANQLKQASNGSPTFQLELGKRYMRGDGVETNLALARHWLESACTNHVAGASNLLEQLR